jgi:glycosyltransferase involved in cell wall biosynthesis
VPILAADVGSLKDEIIEGRTGFAFKPEDHVDLAKTIERYFASDLFANLSSRRHEIRNFAAEGHSWDVVGQLTMNVYADIVRSTLPRNLPGREAAKASPLD